MQTFRNTVLKNRGLSRKQLLNQRAYFEECRKEITLDDRLQMYMRYGFRRSNIYQSLRAFWMRNGETKEVKEACGRWLERNGRLNAGN